MARLPAACQINESALIPPKGLRLGEDQRPDLGGLDLGLPDLAEPDLETAEIEPSVYTAAAEYRGQRIFSLQISEIDGFEEEPSSPAGDDSLVGDSNPR